MNGRALSGVFFTVIVAVLCAGCYSLGEQSFLPPKARLRKDAPVVSIQTRGGRVIDFTDDAGRMNTRCAGSNDTTCVGGVSDKGEHISMPYDSLANVTMLTSHIDYLESSASALIAIAAITSIIILFVHRVKF